MKPNDVLEEVKEETKESTSHIDIDVSQIPSQVKEGLAGHNWVQQGFSLICKSCAAQHSINIGNKIYYGLDDNGVPILKKFR